MPLTKQQENFVSEVEGIASGLLQLRQTLDNVELQWFENAHNVGITDQTLTEAPVAFPHISAAELTGAITALLAVRDVLNTYKGNLVRLKR
jgi:hypothetical protein